MGARETVLALLNRCERDMSYADLALSAALEGSSLEGRDRAFASALFYGTLERRITLDYLLGHFSSIPLEKTDPAVRNILRMGAYQILYMDGVPARAAVSESVELAKSAVKSAAGYVNAVLRALIRAGERLPFPPEGTDESLSVRYSYALWMVKMWARQYGREKTEKILAAQNERLPAVLRLNTVKGTAQELSARILGQIPGAARGLAPELVTTEAAGSVPSLPGFSDGLWFVQDSASFFAARALGVMPGETVFDLCAAPGGKSFSLAMDMRDRGRLLSFDLHEKRVRLIREEAERLGLSVIEAAAMDAAKPREELIGQADAVLCDAPCSGLGVIRKKPDIRFKKEEDVLRLPAAQKAILAGAARCVRPGGRLVYATCTLNTMENDEVTDAFLAEHRDFLPEDFSAGEARSAGGRLTLMPYEQATDGFFIAKFRRRN